MSNPLSPKYLQKVEKHLLGGYPIKLCNMDESQKLRLQICKQVYSLFTANPFLDMRTTIKNIAGQFFNQKRTPDEIKNDIALINHIIGFMEEGSIRNIEKIKVARSSDWLIKHGMATGNFQAVDRGVKIKMDLNNNFRDDGPDMDDMEKVLPLVITNDIGVLRPGQVNYTPEELAEVAKKVGLPEKQVVAMIQNQDGVYETAPQEEEPEPDIFNELTP